MARHPELWAFVLANALLFVVSGLLASLSYVAYRESDGRSALLTAAVGFAFVVLGGLVEPVYQIGITGGSDYGLTGTEFLWLQAGEGVLIAFGLGLLFYAITRYGSGSSSSRDERFPVSDERVGESDYPQIDD